MSHSIGTNPLALRSRRSRRVAVVLAIMLTTSLAASLPPSYNGFAMVVVLALIALDGALVAATGALAFTRRLLDEREATLRNTAYRRGFRLLGTALVVAVATIFISTALRFTASYGSFDSGATLLDNVLTGRGLVAILELLIMFPTFVVAWTDVDRAVDDDVHGCGWRAVGRSAGVAIAAVALWLLAPTVLPDQPVRAVAGDSFSTSGPPGSTCRHVVAGRLVGANLSATIGMRVEVCWDGVSAFVWGDPAIPLPADAVAAMHLPAGVPASVIDPDLGDLTSCTADTVDDFAAVTQTCTATIDTSGTLHYVVSAHISPLPAHIDARDVTLTLVVTGDGRVLATP